MIEDMIGKTLEQVEAQLEELASDIKPYYEVFNYLAAATAVHEYMLLKTQEVSTYQAVCEFIDKYNRTIELSKALSLYVVNHGAHEMTEEEMEKAYSRFVESNMKITPRTRDSDPSAPPRTYELNLLDGKMCDMLLLMFNAGKGEKE